MSDDRDWDDYAKEERLRYEDERRAEKEAHQAWLDAGAIVKTDGAIRQRATPKLRIVK